MQKYKVIHKEDTIILFFPQSMDIITMKPEDFQETSEAQLHECADNFLKRFNEKNHCSIPCNAKHHEHKRELFKIMVNTTDSCNLNCHYCYASKYHEKHFMTTQTMDKVIEKFIMSDSVMSLGRVVFFGGEPLLNLAGIEYFIERVQELATQGKIARKPAFHIITNGTIYSQRIADLFKKYQMGVLVSCDGPAELQNSQRPFRDTQLGSYDIVAQNIRKMVADKQNVSIECTITPRAVELGYDYHKMREFFINEFGIKEISIVPEMTAKKKLQSEPDYYGDFFHYKNMYIEAMMNLEFHDERFEMAQRIFTKKPLLYACGLGMSSFHILANGDIYPCQLVGGVPEFKITDIDTFDDSFFRSNNWITTYQEHSARCNDCWAKPLCKFCPLRVHIEANCFTLPEKACEERRQSLAELIVKVVELRRDPEQYNDFLQRLSSFFKPLH